MATTVAKRTPSQELVGRIRSEDFKNQVALALPAGVSPDRFVRATVTALMQNPDIVKAERESLFQALLRSAQDGLLPDGREAAIVAFGSKAQYLPMVGGLRKVAAKHGFSLAAYVVYEHDAFTYELGLHPRVVHLPPPLGTDRGQPIGAYAVASDEDETYLEVMDKAEIEKVRSVSRAKASGPWVDWWPEMARKTVARRLFKSLPLAELDDVGERIVSAVDADVVLDGYSEEERQALEAATVPRVSVNQASQTSAPEGEGAMADGESAAPSSPPGVDIGTPNKGEAQESFFAEQAEKAQRKKKPDSAP